MGMKWHSLPFGTFRIHWPHNSHMVYSPRLIANAFLVKARESGVQFTHMKVQKLVFFMHAWSLALHGKSVVSERPQAWPYGPVFESLYHELKGYGSSAVDSFLKELNPATGELAAMAPSPKDEEFQRLLGQVWDRYSNFTALQLSALTHETGGPWELTRKSRAGEIADELIRDHYQKKLPSHEPATA